MRCPTGRRDGRRLHAELNMTPMIDVVFLLIVFFLVSSHLARTEASPALELPSATTAQRDDRPTARLVVHLGASGELRLGGARVDPPALAERLRESRLQSAPLRVHLRIDERAPYAAVEPALAACAAAGAEEISIATQAPGGKP